MYMIQKMPKEYALTADLKTYWKWEKNLRVNITHSSNNNSINITTNSRL
jgi:hypothetical protein